jgi:hypothetical protein
MNIATELNRGDDRDVVCWFWGYAPGLVDRALEVASDEWRVASEKRRAVEMAA